MTSHYTTGLPVGRNRLLFLDDTWVESARAVRRNFHQVRRLSDRPLIVPDRPTDLVKVAIHGTVLRDRHDGSLHMWYRPQRFRKDGAVYRICYARSTDGLHWHKPDVGQGEIDGFTAHNVVADSAPIDGGAYSPGSAVHCPDEPDERKRFRRIYQKPSGTFVAHSPAGIVWDETDDFVFHGVDSTCLFYDVLDKRFVAVTIEEPPVGRFPKRRTPAVATSRDFGNWSEFRVAFTCDDLDDQLVVERLEKRRAILSYGIPEHFHQQVDHMHCFNYADAMIGLPVMFDCCGYDEWKGTPGGRGSGRDDAPMHIQLAWCRDQALRDWQRPWREPFLPISEPPRWDCGCQGMAESPIRMGDELWFYYAGVDYSQQHPSCTLNDGWRYRQGDLAGGISVAALRLDGFASLDADRTSGGEVVTKPRVLEGGRILVNAVSYHGLTFEVLDESGAVIPGFSTADCIPFKGNAVDHEVRFKQGRVATLSGRRIKLRFGMSGVMLFAVAFEPSKR